METLRECVVHTTKCAEKTTIASARVAKFLAKELGADLIDTLGAWAERPWPKYHRIYYVNSMGRYAPKEFLFAIAELVRHCHSFIYIQNDYTVQPVSQVQKVLRDELGMSHAQPFETTPPYMWTNIPGNVHGPGSAYVNWNLLTWSPVQIQHERIPGLMYYGSFRKDRVKYFEKYLGPDTSYPVHVSASPVNQKKFLELNPDIICHKPWRTYEELGRFQATIYIEDEHIHTHYNSPANRFYECLSAGVPMFFDETVRNTLAQAGYHDVSVVDGPRTINLEPAYTRYLAQTQRERFSGDFINQLRNQIQQARVVMQNDETQRKIQERKSNGTPPGVEKLS